MSKTVKRPANVDMCGGELQNFRLQNLTSAPASPAAGMPYYDSTNNVPKYYDGTSFKEFGRVYSQSTGITIANDNSISVTDYAKLVKNNATASSSLILLGETSGSANLVSIGSNSSAFTKGVAIGSGASSGNTASISIGYEAETRDTYSIALGGEAMALGKSAIQLGYGTNLVDNSFYVGFYNNSTTHYNWELLNGTTGLIPDARLSSNIVKASAIGANNGIAQLDSSGKVPSSQLPSFVDDVIEVLTMGSEPSTCETGDKYFNTTSNKIFTATAENTWGSTGEDPEKDKIYVAIDTNMSYRWSGSAMINIANPVAAATESTAGIAEIATNSEVITGTDDTRIVTPKKLADNYQTKLTQSTGITISNGNISVTDYGKLAKNTATGTDSLTLLGTAAEHAYSINIGKNSESHGSVAIGYEAQAGTFSDSPASFIYGNAVAIGNNAKATALGAIQIGSGTNNTTGTLSVGLSKLVTGWDVHTNTYTLLTYDGLIPDDRLSSNIARAANCVQKFAVNNPALTASGGGVTWSITNSLGTKDVQVDVYEISTGEQIFPSVTVAQTSPYGITIEMLSSSNIAADTYRAVVMG